MNRIIACSECGEEKNYYATAKCRQCYNHAYGRQWRSQNREHLNDYNRRRYRNHPEKYLVRTSRWAKKNPEKKAADTARYRARHPERAKACLLLWRENHKEQIADYCKHYREAHRAEFAIREARRRARKRSLPDTLTAEQAEHLLMIGRAMYPGEKLHLDHIVPLSRGGATTLANMHAIPASLNCSKYNALPEEIYRQGELTD